MSSIETHLERAKSLFWLTWMAEDLPHQIPRRGSLPIAAGMAYRELQELERLLIKSDVIADETGG